MKEYWDVYDRFRTKTGKIIQRDSDVWLQEGEYHLVITGIIQNSNNKILISKRREDKKVYPGLWECTGGSAKVGENSIQATIREVFEEIGIELKENEGEFLGTIQKNNYFRDVWRFIKEVQDKDIKFLDGEVVDTKWVSIEEYVDLLKKGEIVPSGDLVINLLKEKEMEEER